MVISSVATAPPTATASAPATKPGTSLWFKDAVIYQLHVRSYQDSDGDGIGDFRGLTTRLDYIQSLGVTAIWLLPFYPSPLKDDGYDIADYTNVNPIYGTLQDFEEFLNEAHRRELRVITELVMNHTSDQHEWFQRSRRAKPGGKWREFYVWNDDPHRYTDARIIFKDFESSNWSWDPVAQAYFWHRFYSHQPDLNFENPEVKAAMFGVIDFWMNMGVDGMRLDAVPYLYEREGTSCENLPETHQFLKELRGYLDSKFEDKMLLAEANQWPEDAAAYFGAGDECHMNFNFPLMPRLFMATQREDRLPITDILDQTPRIPDNCQWAIFLRNHDELTLEMVTDEERDYMYRTYADDPAARINLGIRRRLGPLMKDNRRKMELMNALLCSLPGTPVIYYGDEIGMGDNIYLGDRNGVRTPMQWSADRNAGFSAANPQKLFLPVIIDPEYHYSNRNVEAEQNNPHSLLWWTRRLINLRKQHPAFGRGSLEFLYPDNPKVLAFLRQHDGETILVVANLSRFPQYVELDLSRFRGMQVVELYGHARFPSIGDLPYLVTLTPHAFYWFGIYPAAGDSETRSHDLSTVRVQGAWTNLFQGRPRSALESALPGFFRMHRWFGGKSKTIQSTTVEETIPVELSEGKQPVYLALVQVAYTEGEPDRYLLPLSFMDSDHAEGFLKDCPGAAVLRLRAGETTGLVYESSCEEQLWNRLLDLIVHHGSLKGAGGAITSIRTNALDRLLGGDAESPLKPSIHRGEQSNTTAVFGNKLVLKFFRRVHEGRNPDLEISQYLTEHPGTALIPAVGGALEYRRGKGEPWTLALLQEFVPNIGDAWKFTLDSLSRYFEEVSSERSGQQPSEQDLPRTPLLELSRQPVPPLALETIGDYLHSAELLGQRTAEMHVALAANVDNPAFTPEPFTSFYQRGMYQSVRSQTIHGLQFLRKQLPRLPDDAQDVARQALGSQDRILARLQRLLNHKIAATRVRVHGDYHLGQVLATGRDFVILDFEGEPDRPISERRLKRSPLRDVAGMIRSFHYASYAALYGHVPGTAGPEAVGTQEAWTRFWYTWVAATFLRSYLAVASSANFLPKTDDELRTLLDVYLIEKAVYELSYELNSRPKWVRIPLVGILQSADTEA